MDSLTLSLPWGAVTSFVISGLKKLGLKGDWWLKGVNVVLAGGGFFLFEIQNGKSVKEAAIAAISSLLISFGVYGAGTKDIRNAFVKKIEKEDK